LISTIRRSCSIGKSKDGPSPLIPAQQRSPRSLKRAPETALAKARLTSSSFVISH
jgi:hypothetical protein